MENLKELLDKIETLDKLATPARWGTDEQYIYGPPVLVNGYMRTPTIASVLQNDQDAQMITLARNALPLLAETLREILEDTEHIIDSVNQGNLSASSSRGIRAQAEVTLAIISRLENRIGEDHA